MTKDNDQNFNEEELQDIMSEIESLEAEHQTTTQEDRDEDSHMAREPEEAKLVELEKPQASKTPGPRTGMSFKVHGDMKLDLNFQIGEESISLSLDEEDGFIIEMMGGAKFVVPIKDNKTKKSAA